MDIHSHGIPKELLYHWLAWNTQCQAFLDIWCDTTGHTHRTVFLFGLTSQVYDSPRMETYTLAQGTGVCHHSLTEAMHKAVSEIDILTCVCVALHYIENC